MLQHALEHYLCFPWRNLKKTKQKQGSYKQAYSGKWEFKLYPKLSGLYVQIFKPLNGASKYL